MNNIILFDGECNFCDQSVQFIMKRDVHELYKFASIQGEVGQQLVKKYRIAANLDSLIVVSNNKCYFKSTAALNICRNLNGGWKLLRFLFIVPRPIRDFFYDIFAKNRYKWFGKKNSCMLPTPEIRKRFL